MNAAVPPGACSGARGVIEPPLEATHSANSARETTLIWIGMKAWSTPHSSEHWP